MPSRNTRARCMGWALTMAALGTLSPARAEAETIRIAGARKAGAEEPAYQWRVRSSDRDATVVELAITRFEKGMIVVDGDPYSTVTLPGAAQFDEWGYPALPKMNQDIAIPAGATPTLTIDEEDVERFAMDPVAPSKGGLTRGVNPKDVPYVFSDFYRKASWAPKTWPEERAVLGAPFQLRDVTGVNLSLRPFQLDIDAKELVVAKRLVVTIHHAPSPDAPSPWVEGKPMVESFKRLYADHFPNLATQWRGSGVDFPAIPTQAGSLLVLAPEAFCPRLDTFRRVKERRGYRVHMHCGNAELKDPAAVARAIAEYQTADQLLAFVLIVGDEAWVAPHPGRTGNAEGNEADPMYGLLRGDDSYPELFVGRWPVRRADELAVVLGKSLAYETTPEAGDWYRHLVNVASDQWGDVGSPRDSERADRLAEILAPRGYGDVSRIYDPGAKPAPIAAAIDRGAGLVNYIGHGSETMWVTGEFTNQHVHRLANGPRWPVIVSVACVNGDFDYPGGDSFAEKWLKGDLVSGNGAVAIFASSTDQAWVPPTVGQARIAELVAKHGSWPVGALMMAGSAAVLEDASEYAAQTYETWHVFGDPTLDLRTQDPVAVSVKAIRAADDRLDVDVGEAGLTVSVEDAEGRLIGQARSGATGVAALRWQRVPEAGERVSLHVMGADHRPWTQAWDWGR